MNIKWYKLDFDTRAAIVEGGWLISTPQSTFFFPDLHHMSFGTLPDDVAVEPEPTPEPAPTDPVEPEPTPEPEPEPVLQEEVVFDDILQTGWNDYSWAAVNKSYSDPTTVSKAIWVDASKWSALSLNKSGGLDSSKYKSVKFDIKALGDGNQILVFRMTSGQTAAGLNGSINSKFPDGKIPLVWSPVEFTFEELDALMVTVTNLVIQGYTGAIQSPFVIDNIRLVRRDTPYVPPVTDTEPLPATAGWLRAEANHLVGEDGSVWQGRGVNIHDTRGCNSCTYNDPNPEEVKRRIDEAVDVWGANFLRLNLESYASASGRLHWQGVLNDPAYLEDIKSIVSHIGTKPGVRVLLSLWADPTFSDLGWPTEATNLVWKKVAAVFRNAGHVVYGICNEPESNFSGTLDAEVHAAMSGAISAIREVEDSYGTPHHLVLAQGTGGWARHINYYIDNPIQDDNVAYETHVYDAQTLFDDRFIRASATIPVVIGEFGPVDVSGALMTMDDCSKLMQEANANQVSWLAWTFHMRCPPNLLEDTSNGSCGANMTLTPSPWGELVKANLA